MQQEWQAVIAAVSTISGLHTPGFRTKEVTSTPGNVGAEG